MRLPRVLQENFWLKVLSFCIAFVIWVFVRVEEKGEVALRMPVRFLNVPSELVIVDDPVPEIQVVVEGPRTLLAQVEQEVYSYNIDMAEAEAGSQQIRILPGQVPLPRGVQVVRIVPSIIETRLMATERLDLPVQARLTGALAPGFEISTVEVEPADMEILVARGELDGARALRTEPISIEGRKSDWSGIVDIDLNDLHVKSITTREVEVFVQIVPKMVDRPIEGIRVVARGPQERYTVQPTQVRIRVMGPENLVKKLDNTSIEAFVDLLQPIAGRVERPVRVQLPDQVVLLEVSPAEISVRPAP